MFSIFFIFEKVIVLLLLFTNIFFKELKVIVLLFLPVHYSFSNIRECFIGKQHGLSKFMLQLSSKFMLQLYLL